MIRGSLKGGWVAELLKSSIKGQHKILKRALLTSQQGNKPNKTKQLLNETDFIVRSPYESVEIPDQTIDQYVFDKISRWSHRDALVDGVEGRKLTYAQLRDRSRILAVRLQRNFKLKFGDTIAICLPNSIEFPIVTLGALEASLIITTVNPIYTAEEIARQLVDSNAKVIFGLATMQKELEGAVMISKNPIKIVYSKLSQHDVIPTNGINLNELLETSGVDFKDLIEYERDPNDVAMLPYSSGTTGLSKGVLLTSRNIVSNAQMVNYEGDTGSICKFTTEDYQDVLPCVLPFFHIYGLTVTLFSKLQQGCKLITLPSFKPDTFLNSISVHKATVLHIVPPIIIFMGHYDKFESKHAESLRYVMSGAAPMGESDAERFIKKAPKVCFFQGYGLTESSPVALMNFSGKGTNYSTVGHPCPLTQAKIASIGDPTYRGVGPNVTGELLIRGPNIMKGYHNNEKETNEIIVEDGWLRTGDIGHYDENFNFYITDRLKELIKVKGFQVAPAELEEILRDHPKIADAAVIGIPNALTGELPRAYVVKKPNQDITEDEVKAFISNKVAVYKKLDGGVEFITAIPKNATGKILRRVLKEQFMES